MATIQDFKNAPDKALFLLSAQFDKNLYSQLGQPGQITMEERKQIAKELVKNREQYDFNLLMIKLSDLCFLTKGSEFIRGGSVDFLGDILQELAQQTDGEAFVQACKIALQENSEVKGCAFPEQFKMSITLSYILSLITSIAKKFEQDKDDKAYTSNLGQNLANKIFFPLLINSGTPQEGAFLVGPFKQWAGSKPSEVGAYISKFVTDRANVAVNPYYEDKLQNHHNAIQSIKNLIKQKHWVLGGFGIFQGGQIIEMDGVEVRVPHRVAAMAHLINDYEQQQPENKNVFKLYEQIREKAQDALDNPRIGQHGSTRAFYQDVLNNLHVSDSVQEVEQVSEQQKLI